MNTASRIQSVAEPGSVFVGEATKRSTESAIAYADAEDLRAQGQGPAGEALPNPPGGGGGQGGAEVRRPGRPLRRPGSGAPAAQECLPRRARRGQGPPGVACRDCRDRQVPAFVGVLQVRGRAGRFVPVAPGAMSVLRGRRGVLGAGGDGQRPGGHRGGRGPHVGCCQAARGGGALRTRTPRNGGGWSPGCRTSWAWRNERSGRRRTCSPGGACSSSGWPRTAR